jgi:hypothetical protein
VAGLALQAADLEAHDLNLDYETYPIYPFEFN